MAPALPPPPRAGDALRLETNFEMEKKIGKRKQTVPLDLLEDADKMDKPEPPLKKPRRPAKHEIKPAPEEVDLAYKAKVELNQRILGKYMLNPVLAPIIKSKLGVVKPPKTPEQCEDLLNQIRQIMNEMDSQDVIAWGLVKLAHGMEAVNNNLEGAGVVRKLDLEGFGDYVACNADILFEKEIQELHCEWGHWFSPPLIARVGGKFIGAAQSYDYSKRSFEKISEETV